MNVCCSEPEDSGCTCCPVHPQPAMQPVPYYVPVYMPVVPVPYWWSPAPPSPPFPQCTTGQGWITYNTITTTTASAA